MKKYFFFAFYISLLSCSVQQNEIENAIPPSDVMANYLTALEAENFEEAVIMLTPFTIEEMSRVIREDLQEKKRLSGDDSLLKNKILAVYGINLEEVMALSDTQLIMLYFQKLPKYFEFDGNYSLESEEISSDSEAFITVKYQNSAIDTVFFEKHMGEWKIDLSYLVQISAFRTQVLENAHTVQLAVEEFLYFADSRGYPLTIEEMNLPEGLTNPFNGDTAFLITKETPDQTEDPALEGYVTYFVRTDSLYYLITAHGKNGKILIELYPMPEISAEN